MQYIISDKSSLIFMMKSQQLDKYGMRIDQDIFCAQNLFIKQDFDISIFKGNISMFWNSKIYVAYVTLAYINSMKNIKAMLNYPLP